IAVSERATRRTCFCTCERDGGSTVCVCVCFVRASVVSPSLVDAADHIIHLSVKAYAGAPAGVRQEVDWSHRSYVFVLRPWFAVAVCCFFSFVAPKAVSVAARIASRRTLDIARSFQFFQWYNSSTAAPTSHRKKALVVPDSAFVCRLRESFSHTNFSRSMPEKQNLVVFMNIRASVSSCIERYLIVVLCLCSSFQFLAPQLIP
ncbi:unnamed protein product, partial [Pylaiella littoralis]